MKLNEATLNFLYMVSVSRYRDNQSYTLRTLALGLRMSTYVYYMLAYSSLSESQKSVLPKTQPGPAQRNPARYRAKIRPGPGESRAAR